LLFERVVSEGLAHNSYFIGDAGKAAVIDPRRDFQVYLDMAERNHCAITHIFETHRNEDYVIGSPGLAERCGAEIFHGAALDFAYGSPVHDGDTFAFGSLSLKVLGTPGHTEESISLVVSDTEAGEIPLMVFCGDTLFAGDIGRTDFYGNERKQEMAGKIYDSITGKILPLGDGVILCPAHGAGSACGSNIADRPYTTIGYEKAASPLIRMGRTAFVSRRKDEAPYFPPYFRTMERRNREGAPGVPVPVTRPLAVHDVEILRKGRCQILDIRAPGSFAAGHIPGSLSIWPGGISFYAGWFLTYEDPIVIVDDFNQNPEESIRQLFRLGYDTIQGILAGGISSWFRSGRRPFSLKTCPVHELKERLEGGQQPFLLDVRDIRNRRAFGHIPGSHHVYLGELPRHLDEIPLHRPVVVYCDAGFKSTTAASILARHGLRDVTTIIGGITAWRQAGFVIES
jgi:hydroxyacylglutathione hydrolase